MTHFIILIKFRWGKVWLFFLKIVFEGVFFLVNLIFKLYIVSKSRMFFELWIDIMILARFWLNIHVYAFVPNPLLTFFWDTNQMLQGCFIREVKVVIKFFLFVFFLFQFFHFFVNHFINIWVWNVCFRIVSLKLFKFFWNV